MVVIPGRATWREPGIQAATITVEYVDAWIPGSMLRIAPE